MNTGKWWSKRQLDRFCAWVYCLWYIDRNKLNNRLDNLRAVSHTENLQNTERYRNDVTENDKIKRRNLLAKERETKKRRQAGNKQINEKGNGNIHKRKDTKNDRYMAQITWKGIKYSKTFKTKEEANNYINEIKLGWYKNPNI